MYKDKVYLVQSDTTVGFLSCNDKKLSQIKQRTTKQKILQVVDSFKILKYNTRISNKFKNFIRKSKLTTFIYPNKKSFRVVYYDLHHNKFIKKFNNHLYSTSANKTKKTFSFNYAYDRSDIVIFQKDDFIEKKSSKIFQISKSKMKKIR